MNTPQISVVIPVYNEAGSLEKLYERLTTVLDNHATPYEIIFTNDGSKDNSSEILAKLHKKRPQQIRVIEFLGNFGQHMAVIAGFEKARGDIIVTMDSDLEDPPEELPKLMAPLANGYDLVNGVRERNTRSWFRRKISMLVNKIREKITRIHMTDHGCMMRAYSRPIIDLIIETRESAMFIPALANSYANNPTEVTVKQEKRNSGQSSYRLFDLVRLYFDLMTGYSLVPLQVFTMMGMFISFMSFLFVVYLFIRRIVVGPEASGVFTLFAIMFFLCGIILMGLGITGEYIGRIYQDVRQKPRFVIKEVLEEKTT